MKMPESLKNSREKSKKALKTAGVAIPLASVLTSCGADNNTMTFDKEDQSGKMSVTYVGREPKKFTIEVKKQKDGSYKGILDESGWGVYEEYEGDLSKVMSLLSHELQEQVFSAQVSSTESAEELANLTEKKLAVFTKKYQEFLVGKGDQSSEYHYTPDAK